MKGQVSPRATTIWWIVFVFILLATLAIVLASAAGASTLPPTQVSGNGFTCSRTQPEYMINAGGSVINVRENSYKFSVADVDAPGYSGLSAPYITAGYNSYRDSTLCNTRQFHGSHGSRSYKLPVQLGKQGHLLTSVHDNISPDFTGNSGFDIWFTQHPNEHSYSTMTNGGSGTTEIMIWFQHRDLPDAEFHDTWIDGYPWGTTVGLADNGHGRTATRKGWNVINFIAQYTSSGSVRYQNLALNTFFAYAISHGWLRQSDYLMSVNQGFEILSGSASVAGYSLTGLPH